MLPLKWGNSTLLPCLKGTIIMLFSTSYIVSHISLQRSLWKKDMRKDSFKGVLSFCKAFFFRESYQCLQNIAPIFLLKREQKTCVFADTGIVWLGDSSENNYFNIHSTQREAQSLSFPTYMPTSLSKCLVSLLKWLIKGLKWLSKQPKTA